MLGVAGFVVAHVAPFVRRRPESCQWLWCKVCLLGMAAKPGANVRTDRDHLQPALAQIIHGALNELTGQSVTLKLTIDLGVHKRHGTWLEHVADLSDHRSAVIEEFVAKLLRVVAHERHAASSALGAAKVGRGRRLKIAKLNRSGAPLRREVAGVPGSSPRAGFICALKKREQRSARVTRRANLFVRKECQRTVARRNPL